jgi:hypothetical protein
MNWRDKKKNQKILKSTYPYDIIQGEKPEAKYDFFFFLQHSYFRNSELLKGNELPGSLSIPKWEQKLPQNLWETKGSSEARTGSGWFCGSGFLALNGTFFYWAALFFGTWGGKQVEVEEGKGLLGQCSLGQEQESCQERRECWGLCKQGNGDNSHFFQKSRQSSRWEISQIAGCGKQP